MARQYFCAYFSTLEAIAPLNDEEVGRLFRALLIYSSTGQTPTLKGNEQFIFPAMKAQIDRDSERYSARCKANKQNIESRWHTTEYDGIRLYTNDTKEKEKEKDKAKTKEKEKETKGEISFEEIFERG